MRNAFALYFVFGMVFASLNYGDVCDCNPYFHNYSIIGLMGVNLIIITLF
jgi:hypothetical protein